jgi:hypothetical protein
MINVTCGLLPIFVSLEIQLFTVPYPTKKLTFRRAMTLHLELRHA